MRTKRFVLTISTLLILCMAGPLLADIKSSPSVSSIQNNSGLPITLSVSLSPQRSEGGDSGMTMIKAAESNALSVDEKYSNGRPTNEFYLAVSMTSHGGAVIETNGSAGSRENGNQNSAVQLKNQEGVEDRSKGYPYAMAAVVLGLLGLISVARRI